MLLNWGGNRDLLRHINSGRLPSFKDSFDSRYVLFTSHFLHSAMAKCETIHAIRPIKVGEDITISYEKGGPSGSAFSYCPSESKESYSFFWESLKAFCFTDTNDGPAAVPPRVILGDQAGGIVAFVPIAFPSTQVQSCDWHAVEAMEAKYRKSGYRKDEIRGWVDGNGEYHSGLKDLSWAYVKSATIEQLEANRQFLLDALKSEDQD
jgi:hypothetical protein